MDNVDENDLLAKSFGGTCPRCGSKYPLVRVVKNRKEYDIVIKKQYFHNITFECMKKKCTRFRRQRWDLRLPASKYWKALRKDK